MILRFFLFVSFLISPCIGATDFSIDFFNVGQGNCTVVYFGKGSPLLIVDVGSSSEDKSYERLEAVTFSSSAGVVSRDDDEEGTGTGGAGVADSGKDSDGEDSDEEAEAISAVSFKIKRLRVISDIAKERYLFRDINVVISHGDIDHCNWMVDLVEKITEGKKTVRVRALLGGSIEDYSSRELASVIDFAKKSKKTSPEKKVYVKEYGDVGAIPPFECGEDGGFCTILAADTRTKDKNRHSIVLEVGKGLFSAILTGDAPGVVMDRIPITSYARLPGDGIRIFQASHHGADSHESNSPELFGSLQPHYCVISTGSRKDYGHPRQRMIINALSSGNIQESTAPHLLQYYSDYPFIDTHPKLEEHLTIGRLENDFVVGLTSLGIFSTASQGDIHFEGGEFTFTKALPSTSMTSVPSHTIVADFLENYGRLGDASPLLSFRLPFVVFPTAVEFSEFVEKIPNVISCDLSRANLSGIAVDDIIASVLGLIGRPNLRELELPASLNSVESIKKAWTEKGLKPKSLRFVSYCPSPLA